MSGAGVIRPLCASGDALPLRQWRERSRADVHLKSILGATGPGATTTHAASMVLAMQNWRHAIQTSRGYR